MPPLAMNAINAKNVMHGAVLGRHGAMARPMQARAWSQAARAGKARPTLPMPMLLPGTAPMASALPLPGHRRLSCAAGFLQSDVSAQQVAQDLRLVFGLDQRQVSVLAPADGLAHRFAEVSRRWGRAQPKFDQRHGVWALTVGLAAVVAVLAFGLQLGALLAGLAAVALAGALVIGLRPRPKRFDRVVQSRLSNGAWAVLVCDVPADLQADVLTALRYNSQHWCADAPHRRRL